MAKNIRMISTTMSWMGKSAEKGCCWLEKEEKERREKSPMICFAPDRDLLMLPGTSFLNMDKHVNSLARWPLSAVYTYESLDAAKIFEPRMFRRG